MESDIFSVRIHNNMNLEMFKTSFDNSKENVKSLSESTLIIIEHPDVKERIEKLWKDYVEDNPGTEYINIDKFSLNKENVNLKEYEVYKKISSLYERNFKNRLLILNENIDNRELW